MFGIAGRRPQGVRHPGQVVSVGGHPGFAGPGTAKHSISSGSPRPDQRLAAGEADRRRRGHADPGHPAISSKVRMSSWEPGTPFGHAVHAAEIAAVGHRNAHLAHDAAKGVYKPGRCPNFGHGGPHIPCVPPLTYRTRNGTLFQPLRFRPMRQSAGRRRPRSAPAPIGRARRWSRSRPRRCSPAGKGTGPSASTPAAESRR